MILFVGLGNPGLKYLNNRHNIGYMVIDHMLASHVATPVRKSSFEGELFKTQSLLFLKPTTFMNLSGQSVNAVAAYFKPERIVVIHDDLDLPFGTVRFKCGGGHGGHNGLKSIDAHIGKDYYRVRIGVGKPQDKSLVSNFVLADFPKKHQAKKEEIIEHCAKACLDFCCEDLATIASKYSLKNNWDQEAQ